VLICLFLPPTLLGEFQWNLVVVEGGGGGGGGGEQQNLARGFHFVGPYQLGTPSALHINERGLRQFYNFDVPDYDDV